MPRKAQKYLDALLSDAEAYGKLCLEVGRQWQGAQAESQRHWLAREVALDAACAEEERAPHAEQSATGEDNADSGRGDGSSASE